MLLDTPLGADALVVRGVRGREAISELFHFEVEACWTKPKSPVQFDALLGQKVTLKFKQYEDTRYVGGIVSRLSQLDRDANFIYYRIEIVPQLWLFTLTRRSRIFQQMSVPDILKKVLTGMDVAWELQGTYEPREYCVQYNETDFDFFSRLAEEEGIYYFFKHTEAGHKLTVADTTGSHSDIPYLATATWERMDTQGEDRILEWSKTQEIRSGKYTLWDEIFQMPGKNLEAMKTIAETVAAGTVTHKLKIAGNDAMEVYEFPGGYARRFDGIDKGGAERASELQKIFNDNKRTVEIRMQQEAVRSLLACGNSRHSGLTAGHAFTLSNHFSDDGKYVLTAVEHEARQPIEVKSDEAFTYNNKFECIPQKLPFRPQRRVPTPSPRGVQLATVTGPAGQEIFTDKYGRIKVQFHWDREGKNDATSSCWVRVATHWAGKNWGAIHIPRVGQEVVIDFEEGDINHPIVIGSVYNADMMPPYALPDNRTQSGIMSRSTPNGAQAEFNSIRFEDKKGNEEVYVHAQKDMNVMVEHDRSRTIVNHETKLVKEGDESITLEKGKRTILLKTGDQSTTLDQGNRSSLLKMGNETTTLDMGNLSTRLKMGDQDIKIDLGKSTEEAMQSIELKVGQSSIKIDQMGVTIKGMAILIDGSISAEMKSMVTTVQANGVLTARGALVQIN